jgi:hypothetical protein
MNRRDVLKAIAAAGLSFPIASITKAEVTPHCIIAISSDGSISHEGIKALKVQLAKRAGHDNFTLLFMPLNASIESLPEKEMNRAGWYRR